jgi:hypothetical protein
MRKDDARFPRRRARDDNEHDAMLLGGDRGPDTEYIATVIVQSP